MRTGSEEGLGERLNLVLLGSAAGPGSRDRIKGVEDQQVLMLMAITSV